VIVVINKPITNPKGVFSGITRYNVYISGIYSWQEDEICVTNYHPSTVADELDTMYSVST
jgi:hypothetical protein